MTYSITKNGKTLDPSKYTIDPINKTFSTEESYLVLDFSGEVGWAFKTGSNCTFNTGSDCNFITSWHCTFNTSPYCTFDTGWDCTFNTGSYCNFITSSDCTFNTSWGCTFKTGFRCSFKTGEKCVIIRRDIYEIIEIPEGIQIKLNEYGVLGYKIIPQKKTITIDGKDITISEDSFNELKRQLT